MRIKFLFFLMLLVPLAHVAGADSSVITLKDLEQEALRHNPEILRAEKKVESADEKKSLASALPDPMIGFMAQNVGSPVTWSVGKEDMSMQGVCFRRRSRSRANSARGAARQLNRRRERRQRPARQGSRS
jgi:hypothetical protein